MAPDETQPPGTSAQPFTVAAPDLSELRLQHFQLQRQRQDGPVPDLVKLALALRLAAQDAGCWIEPLADRDTAQGIIDFWTSVIASESGQRFPDLLDLAAYDPHCGEHFRDHAEQVFDSLRERYDEAFTNDLLLSVDPRWVGRLPAILPAARLERVQSAEADAVREELLAAGLLRHVAGEELDDAANAAQVHTLRHRALLEQKGKFAVAVQEAHVLESHRSKLDADAAYWAESERAKGDLLLRGKSLDAAQKLSQLDDQTAAYIAASRTARNKRWISACVGALVIAVALGAVWLLSREGGEAAGSNDAENRFETEVISPGEATAQTQPVAGQDPAIEIAMWIGSANVPLLAGVGQDRVDPATVRKDMVYRARTDIWLRQGPPERASYRSKAEYAVMPEGGEVEVLQLYEPYDRPGAAQYWAQVRRVFRVYPHYPTSANRTAEAFLTGLPESALERFVVQQSERLAGASGRYDVRYNSRHDRYAARAVMERMLAHRPPQRGIRPQCIDLSTRPDEQRGAAGTLEVWVDPAITVDPGEPFPLPPSCMDAPRSALPTAGDTARPTAVAAN